MGINPLTRFHPPAGSAEVDPELCRRALNCDQVAFVARGDQSLSNSMPPNPNTTFRGIYTNSGEDNTEIANNRGVFDRFNSIDINDSGRVAFLARLDSSDPMLFFPGIFTGSDPVADRVIAKGDSLFGSTVTDLNFFNKGLNNSGQIAFFASLEGGREVIVRATPVPAPSEALSTLAFGALGASYMLKRKLKKQKSVNPETSTT